MLRPTLFSAAFLALTACQVDEPPQARTPAERMALAAVKIEDCARTSCTTLDLDRQLVADYGVAANLTHVTSFMASFSDFNDADLAAIAPMSQLRELHVGNTQLSGIGGVTAFPNLTLLHAQWNDLADPSPIGQLTKLEELALSGTDVGNMSFLRGLRRLERLRLDSADITSLEVLRGHPSLRQIDLAEATLPDDISVLLTIPNLENVSVTQVMLEESQVAVIAQLEAAGVEITRTVSIIVC